MNDWWYLGWMADDSLKAPLILKQSPHFDEKLLIVGKNIGPETWLF